MFPNEAFKLSLTDRSTGHFVSTALRVKLAPPEMLQGRTCAVTYLLFFSLKSSIWLSHLAYDLDSYGSVIIIWFDNTTG